MLIIIRHCCHDYKVNQKKRVCAQEIENWVLNLGMTNIKVTTIKVQGYKVNLSFYKHLE